MRVYGAYSQNPTRLPDSVRSCEVEDGPRHSRFREQEACTNRPLISTDIFWRADGVGESVRGRRGRDADCSRQTSRRSGRSFVPQIRRGNIAERGYDADSRSRAL